DAGHPGPSPVGGGVVQELHADHPASPGARHLRRGGAGQGRETTHRRTRSAVRGHRRAAALTSAHRTERHSRATTHAQLAKTHTFTNETHAHGRRHTLAGRDTRSPTITGEGPKTWVRWTAGSRW